MSDPKNWEIPGHVSLTTGEGGLPKVVVETPCSSAEIYLHGAHVTGFQKKGEPPLLFMSAASEFTAGKAIRGGVPVIFPWFGAREGLPFHAFARITTWELKETSLLPNGAVRLRFVLPGAEGFHTEYLVTVAESLTLELAVENTGDRDSAFEACLHTYFQISGIDAISITGLAGTRYQDKVAATTETQTSAAIRISSEVDRVYPDTAATTEIEDPGFGRKIRIAKSSSHSTVVWNPWIEKSKRMPDFGDEEYLQMVCVESGNVGKNNVTLPPGGHAVMKVEISSERLLS
jgi:D-hexose-6-phosphate mutarotase